MYEQFFALRERPFDLAPDPRFLVLTDAHREALSNLEYGIASRKGLTLLVGEPGTGKTTLIRAAIERQPARVHCVHLSNPTLSRVEFNEMLAIRFELSPTATRSKTAMLIELETLLRDGYARDETTVLMLDEAQSLSPELLEEVRLLANIETNETKLLSLIMAGQPELVARLNDPSLRQLKQRVALRCMLRALTFAETSSYLAGRIRAAGGIGAQVFTHDAVEVIYQRSRGLPRAISVIADNALVGGLAAGQKPVTKRLVEEICRDFDIATVEDDEPTLRQPPSFFKQAPPAERAEFSGETKPPAPSDEQAESAAAAADGRAEMFSGMKRRSRFSFFGR